MKILKLALASLVLLSGAAFIIFTNLEAASDRSSKTPGQVDLASYASPEGNGHVDTSSITAPEGAARVDVA